ncbi:acetyl-CoA carboxylase biotin carboxyl carrier protein subunit [Fulvivirga sediminis]|uniref:Acetyl-CoA carboxylase biotin carboxyl carrier protein subunit n=1 Tax=Fulvivirga sediminis TaxID=2803949 RepID=A0A937F928_9BACT|nr:acetyl-CoA carboxylase biotin carboxyl carrier protein subunit [Fulvivirga sediminis]MBL3656864.1 acetyl-CoA carboxylase biotin carboxyl carrier protein subunit [Fulvivirga sediminis]
MYKAIIGDKPFNIQLKEDEILINDKLFSWDISKVNEHSYHILKNDISYRIEVAEINYKTKEVILKINGHKYEVKVKDKLDLLLEKLGMDMSTAPNINEVKAPMPGLILQVNVSEGDEVKEGDALMILEAMKMENVLKAPGDGIIKAVNVNQGDGVEKNQVLVQF